MKTNAKTLIERLGFQDPDRLLSRHDDIHLWVYDNILNILTHFTRREKRFDITLKAMEHPVIQSSERYRTIVGFIDLYVHGVITDPSTSNWKPFEACIEVKSRIPSCGDLIRQITFYRSFQRHPATWIVVSPEDRFKNVLLEHGIYFFKYAPGPATPALTLDFGDRQNT